MLLALLPKAIMAVTCEARGPKATTMVEMDCMFVIERWRAWIASKMRLLEVMKLI